MGRFTISMAIFKSYISFYQRVRMCIGTRELASHPTWKSRNWWRSGVWAHGLWSPWNSDSQSRQNSHQVTRVFWKTLLKYVDVLQSQCNHRWFSWVNCRISPHPITVNIQTRLPSASSAWWFSCQAKCKQKNVQPHGTRTNFIGVWGLCIPKKTACHRESD